MSHSRSMSHSHSMSQSTSQSMSVSYDWFDWVITITRKTLSRDLGHRVHILNSTDVLMTQPFCAYISIYCDGGRMFHLKYDPNLVEWRVQQSVRFPASWYDAMFGTELEYGDGWVFITASNTQYMNFTSGAVFVMQYRTTQPIGWQKVGSLRSRLEQNDDMFGHSVSYTPEVVAVGAPGASCDAGQRCGAVFLFRLNSANTWIPHRPELRPSTEEAYEGFGSSVAANNGRIFVGTNTTDMSLNRIYVFQESASVYVQVQRYDAASNQAGHLGFKLVFDSARNKLYATMPYDSVIELNAGAIDVFSVAQNDNIALEGRINPLSGHGSTAGLRFGHAISLDGDRMVVGTNTCPLGSNCDGKGMCSRIQIFSVLSMRISIPE
eukprot:TRINITY_DN4089_c0_g1_i11.p1 TRINITY_DN4089_c0_g1~~TRINITY_DN4089_c0_g1_i11.p1  ORF type:complete len:379 (-),score=59.99 TRINITY_DN4089_c0_g1_i11:882-2018(-)